MPNYNRKCFYCGEEYYCCRSCITIDSWKNVCCSIDCFLKLQNNKKTEEVIPIVINERVKEVVVLRGCLKKNGKTIDIVGYDLDLGKFDCSDNTTKVIEDFNYFIVPATEMETFKSKNRR